MHEKTQYILKDMSKEEETEAVYKIIDDDEELEAVSRVFAEQLDDMELEY